MTRSHFTDGQREAIREAARDYAWREPGEDVVDVATRTANYWWTGLDDHRSRIVLRLFALEENRVRV